MAGICCSALAEDKEAWLCSPDEVEFGDIKPQALWLRSQRKVDPHLPQEWHGTAPEVYPQEVTLSKTHLQVKNLKALGLRREREGKEWVLILHLQSLPSPPSLHSPGN